MNVVAQWNIVRTSYETGPYVITSVFGPCSCATMFSDEPREPHYHMECERADTGEGGFGLNGYRLDGTSVSSGDTLELIGSTVGQLSFL